MRTFVRSGCFVVTLLFLCRIGTAQTCALPVNGGTASSTANNVCPVTYVGLNVNGATTGNGLSYQWQSSPDNAVWTDIAGATGINSTIQQRATTWYRRQTTCSAGGFAYSSSVQVVSKPFATCYCIPTTSNCATGYSITKVVYGSINNSSTCSGAGYGDFTATLAPADIPQGSWLPIAVTVASATSSRYVNCFVDHDQNGRFDETERTVLSQPAGNVYNGFIKVPYSAPLGIIRMRIVFSTYGANPCTMETNAEAEDYAINIVPKTTTANGHVIYVKQVLSGTISNGRDWATPLFDLRSALALATPGDTIKVGKGTYNNGTVRTNGIVLADSVALLGGYPDLGNPTDAQRNPGTNPTIINGRPTSTSTNADYHVLFASGTYNNCTVDGFIIQNGGNRFDGTPAQLKGGGISLENGANVTVRNCVFRYHTEYLNDGLAVAVNNAKPVFENCIIAGNGGSYTKSNILIENGSMVQFINTVAAGNVGNLLMLVDSSKVSWRNGTIAGNIFTQKVISAERKSELDFANTIAYYNGVFNSSWQTSSYDSSEVSLQGASTAAFRYCLTQVAAGVNMVSGIAPRFRDTSSVVGADGYYFTGDDGFSLINPCSPAINTGSNGEAAGIFTDIARQQRVFGTTVDIGAYEVQATPAAVPAVVYVKATATGANDGSSWANAFTDLHRALATCSDTIKTAAGTYFPWKVAKGRPYIFENKRIVLGAYPATGNPSNADRNYTLYPTYINGEISGADRADILARGQGLDSTSVIDGLTFTNTGKYNYATEYGSVIYSLCNNPVISNCTFTGNSRRVFWGRKNKNPLLRNCIFSGNTPSDTYSLDLMVLTDNEKTTFKNCQFSNNLLTSNTSTVGEYGKLLLLSRTHAIIDSCTFQRNYANVLTVLHSNPVITNTSFLQNYAKEQSTDLLNAYSNPQFDNCIFSDSSWSYAYTARGGIMNNYISNPVFTNCRFYNGKVDGYGGVAYNDSSRAIFRNCVFVNNQNAFYNKSSSDMELVNCLAIDGSTANYGGAASFMHNQASSPVLVNCVVSNHRSNAAGVINNDASSSPKIYNSILWRNYQAATAEAPALAARADIKNAAGAQPVIHNSSFEFYEAGPAAANTKGTDPRFKNIDNAIGPDNTWFSSDDGLRLCDCSPALNTGNNTAVQATTDITGLPRIFGVVDRGAYETQSIPAAVPKTVYVDAAASGNASGDSWMNAYKELRPALTNACADTIKMAGGIYKPAKTARDSSFYLNRNLVIMGSYATASERSDVDATPTVFSGDIGLANDTADNTHTILKAFYIDSLTLDGVVLQGAKQNAFSANYLQQLFIRNTRFYDNYAGNDIGAGLVLSNTKAANIWKTVFRGNKAVWGGGIYFNNNQSAKVWDCVFTKNEASFQGGGLWLGHYGVSFQNCLFTQNAAVQGGGMLVYNNVDATVTNCTFANNIILPMAGNGGAYGGGIYSSSLSFLGGGPGPYISNCIFTGNTYSTQVGQATFCDIYYPKNSSPPLNGQLDLRIHHSAVTTPPVYYYGGGLIAPNSIRYKNESNPIGPDNRWFTGDDGLQLSVCSNGINNGDNGFVVVPKDLAGNDRIINTTVDVGAYEYNAMPVYSGLLSVAADSLIANKELTDSAGWTHYYRDCRYLLSIKKAGKNIGTIGDANFEVKVVTGTNYGTGQGMNLTAAAYNTSGLPWVVMNRYWNVKSVAIIGDSILVRFPYTTADFTDVKASNPAIAKQTQMDFFKVSGTNYPFDLSVSASNFLKYNYAPAASLKTWAYSQQDTVHLADYYVSSFSGGGGGAVNFGPLPDLLVNNVFISAQAASPNTSLLASVVEKNAGTAPAGAHKLFVYLSADNQLTPGLNGDMLIGQSFIATSLPAGTAGDTVRLNFATPCNALPGNYTLFFFADGENVLAEGNEQNNLLALPFTVTAGSGLPSAPVIAVTPSASICAPGTITLAATAANCFGCSYSWSSGQTTQTITVALSGTYTLTATNVCGSSQASQTVAVLAQPDFSISTPGSVCQNATAVFSASGAATYTWAGPGLNATTGSSVTATPNISGPTQYSVTAMAGNGCSRTKTFTVNVLAAPTVDILLSDATVCPTGSVTLQATASSPLLNVWTPATGLNINAGTTVIASPTTTTKYYFSAESINNCVAKDSILITVLPASGCIQQADLYISSQSISTSPTMIGSATTVNFNENNAGGVGAGPHKVFFYLSADNVLTPGQNGDVLLDSYAVSGLAAGGNTGLLSKQINIPCNTIAGSYRLFVVADGAGEIVEMSETNNVFTPSSFLTVERFTVTASANVGSICAGSPVILTASSTATSFTWSGPGLNTNTGTSVTALPTTPGLQTYTVTASSNGCSQTASVAVNVTAQPSLSITPGDTTICTGSTVTLTASGAANYSWSPAAGLSTTTGSTVVATPAASTTYTVTGTMNGCTSSYNRTVGVATPVTPSVSISYTGCPGTALSFTATPVNGGNNPQYLWYVNGQPSVTGAQFLLNSAANNSQVYVQMLSNAGCPTPVMVNSTVTTVSCITTAAPVIDALETFSVLPKPTDGPVVIKLKLRQLKMVSFRMTDAYGKLLFESKPAGLNGSVTKRMDLGGHAAGVYYLHITIGKESFVEKIVVMR